MRIPFSGGPRAWCALAVAGVLSWAGSASAAVISDFSETFTPDSANLTYGAYTIEEKDGKICVIFDLANGLNVSASASGPNQTTNLITSGSFKIDLGVEVTDLVVNFYEDGGWGAGQGGAVAAVGTVIVRPDNSSGNFLYVASNPTEVFDGGQWSTSTSVIVPVAASVFQIDFNNNLVASTGNATVLNSAFIDKKYLEICFEIPDDGGAIPEPASLGVLGLGAMALLARRRR